jgi:hypothetical protein
MSETDDGESSDMMTQFTRATAQGEYVVFSLAIGFGRWRFRFLQVR